MSYGKYDSRMSQRYLNQNLIVSLTWDFFENRAPEQELNQSQSADSQLHQAVAISQSLGSTFTETDFDEPCILLLLHLNFSINTLCWYYCTDDLHFVQLSLFLFFLSFAVNKDFHIPWQTVN